MCSSRQLKKNLRNFEWVPPPYTGLLILPFLLFPLTISSPISASSSPIAKREPACHDLTIPVSITCKNAAIPGGAWPNMLNLLGLVDGLLGGLVFSNVVEGNFEIAGTYCEPEVVVSGRWNTLQMLAHPATYDRFWWSGGAPPGQGYDGDKYSWVSTASKNGYPTFFFDRLGAGASSHPDSITVVQVPAQIEVHHQLVLLARSGGTAASKGPFPRAFDKVIYVGHSMGALIGNPHNIKYPSDFDATILGGWSEHWASTVPGFILTAGLAPASIVNEDKWGDLDVGYLTPTSPDGTAFELFYGPARVNYDPVFIEQSFENRGIITVGEGVTGTIAITPAPEYTNPILVITGEQDVLFCGSLGLELTGSGNCGSAAGGVLAQTQRLYPNSRNYTGFGVPKSGHCWMHQYNSQLGYNFSHAWLEGNGF